VKAFIERHAAPLAILGTAAFALLWLWLMRGATEEWSGWSTLAAQHPAGDRVLTGSHGTATVGLRLRGGTRYEFRERTGYTWIEVGLEEDGFWLRSQHGAPQPAVFVPWARVRRCVFTTATLEGSDIEVSVNLQPFIDSCQAKVYGASG
jgi:hypothetical protein